MALWPLTARRRRRLEPDLVAALEETFGKDAVTVAKANGTVGSMLALIRPGRRTLPRRGQQRLLEAYAEMPWVRAVAGKIGESIAATEWIALRSTNVGNAQEAAATARFYSKASPDRRKRLRKQMELVELPGHPMLDLLEEGNEFHTGMTIAEVTQLHLELVGEGFWVKERNGMGRPTELWSIPPHWVRGTPHPGPDADSFTLFLDGQETALPMSEVIWFKKPDPYLPYGRGVGTGRALSDELDTDEYAAKHMKGWFVNGAIPDLLVSADGLSPENTKRMEEDWLDKQQGWWNRFKPYFVGKKLTVTKLTSSFRDMGLGQLRKDQRDVIIHTWGVAPEMFGITENSNRANITGAFYQYARWVLVPRLELKRVFLQTRLAVDYEPGLIIDYVSPVEADKAHVLNVMKAAPWAFNVDEWREEAGRTELADDAGKVHAAPFNLIFSETPGGGGGASTSTEPGGGELSAGEHVVGIPETCASPVTADPEQKVTPQEQQIIGMILESIDAGILDDALRPVIEEAVVGFGTATLEGISPGIAFDIDDPVVSDFLTNGRKAPIVDANKTTQKLIRGTLAEGFDAGENIASLQARIEAEFADAIGTRSHTIARTESVSSSNFGANEAIKQSGIGYKSWLAVRDNVTRDGHKALDSQPPIPANENFTSPDTGASASYPGGFGVPEEDINCRCAVTAEQAPKSGEEPATHLDTEELRGAAWRSFEADRAPYEKAMQKAAVDAFEEQEKAAVAALREAT